MILIVEPVLATAYDFLQQKFLKSTQKSWTREITKYFITVVNSESFLE